MSCCGNFSSVGVAPATTPSHHVNFSTGMVLGVDDYAQEFSYHSARDKWIVRDFGGYGTLSGLAVTVENGADGPQVKVTAGSAATPGGQLICVGADQCGSLNAWLAREDIAARVAEFAAEVAPSTDARLKVWLTLCYTSCAIAPVPIPGQPCRSEEDLMAPSRQADDYILSLSFDPPAMSEAQALDIMETYIGAMVPQPGVINLSDLLTKIGLQLDALFLPQPTALGNSAMSPPAYNKAQKAEVLRFIRNHWITRLRPHVMAQKCNGRDVAANDCVLLATLTVAVSKPPVGAWNVVGGVAGVDKDESDRPLLMSPALAASSMGITAPAPVPNPAKTVAYLSAPAVPPPVVSIGANARVALVQYGVAVTVTLPPAGAGTQQQRIFIRNLGKANAALIAAAPAGRVGGLANLNLSAGAYAHLISDGTGSWRLLGKSA
jgi:hypothetical protein